MKELVALLSLVLVIGLACSRDSATESELDKMLAKAGQEDIVGGGKTVDVLLYETPGMTIWYRSVQLMKEGSIVYVPKGKRKAAVYVFLEKRCLRAIPVDVTLQPYTPTVYPFERGKVLVVSYRYGDMEAIRAGHIRYSVRVHLAAKEACEQVFDQEFDALWRAEGDCLASCTYVPFLNPRGRMSIVKLVWNYPVGPGGKVRLSSDGTYWWDVAADRFVQDTEESRP